MSAAPGRRKPSTTSGEGPAFQTVAENAMKQWFAVAASAPSSRSFPSASSMPYDGSGWRSGRGAFALPVAAAVAAFAAGAIPPVLRRTPPATDASFATVSACRASAWRAAVTALTESGLPQVFVGPLGLGVGVPVSVGDPGGVSLGLGVGPGVVLIVSVTVVEACAVGTVNSVRQRLPS